ncbi:MAG: hypothetical protein KDA60_08160, partial [Planctomycetales bacterium]|nr:hypothetical protein [Planctomycetales bacterium]
MHSPQQQPIISRSLRQLTLLALLGVVHVSVQFSSAQETTPPATETDHANVSTSIGPHGQGSIIVEAHGTLPQPPVFYTATVTTVAKVNSDHIEQTIELAARVVQGDAKTLTLGLQGDGQVVNVEADQLKSWSVRRSGDQRFLDLQVHEQTSDFRCHITIRSAKFSLPTTTELTHITPGESIGFHSTVNLQFAANVDGTVAEVRGFVPVNLTQQANTLQTATGGLVRLALKRSGASSGPIELTNTTLTGILHANGKSVQFQLGGTAHVTEANSELTVLTGNAAISHVPASDNYRIHLVTDNGKPVYKLVFPNTGIFPVELEFVATLRSPDANWQELDFTIAASAVVPLTLSGLDGDIEFQRDQQFVVPVRNDDAWLGFLPATGHAQLQWKAARKTGEGKLFFTSTGLIEAQVGAGLLRQDHQIDYKVLQGELTSLAIQMRGPGEILDVQGQHIVAWKVMGEGDDRQLDITLSQPMTAEGQVRVRSQTPLGPFPIRVNGLRLSPVGAIRHSGSLRLSNIGSVSLEPTGLSGLTQLAPDQFPGEGIESRQVYVYRFPAAEHDFTIIADRIQPEVNVAQIVLYQLTDTDRSIVADVELDIREAPIREWDISIPADYSVVTVTGASVTDYLPSTDVVDNSRNLRVLFGQDVVGRQLVSLRLEKNEPAAAGDWVLPKLDYPSAKSVRGDIGILGAAGYRVSASETDLLVEKPLSYFPKPSANLQQAFRIRESGWSATVQIDPLDRNVQADVFHLYSLSQQTVYGSALVNYFVTGAPVSEWTLTVPAALGNVGVDGQDVRTWRREGDTLVVTLHQPVMGPYTLLVTFEQKPNETNQTFQAGQIAPLGVQGERGYVQVVSPMQVEITPESVSDAMLKLDPLELPAEFRLLSTAPPLGTWQYTERPFALQLKVDWFRPGETVAQLVEFSEANSRVSQDGELVTDVLYYVKSRGERSLKIKLPDDPVRLWEVAVGGRPVTARQANGMTLIPLPGGADPNLPVEVRLRFGKPTVRASRPVLTLPIVFAPVLKTEWNVVGDERRVLVPSGGTVAPPVPVLSPSGFDWLVKRGLPQLAVILVLTCVGAWAAGKSGLLQFVGVLAVTAAILVSLGATIRSLAQIQSPAPLRMSLPILSAEEVVRLQVVNMPLWRATLSWLGVGLLGVGIAVIAWSFVDQVSGRKGMLRLGGVLLAALGVLCHGNSAPWFFGLLVIAIICFVLVPAAKRSWHRIATRRHNDSERNDATPDDQSDGPPPAVPASLLLLALVLASWATPPAAASETLQTADTIQQQWHVSAENAKLQAEGTVVLSGRPGDQFVLLRAPAVLTDFNGEGLRLTKMELPDIGLTYVITIPITEDASLAAGEESGDGADATTDDEAQSTVTKHEATFKYQLEATRPAVGLPVLTGLASVQEIELSYDQAGWEILSPSAIRIEAM